MKKLWLGILGLAVASTAQAAVVTFTLSLHEGTTGAATAASTFAVWATASADNAGLYAYGVDMKTSDPSEGGIITRSSLVNRTANGSWTIDDADPNYNGDWDAAGGYAVKSGGFGTGRGVSAGPAPGPFGVVSGVQDLAKEPNLVKLYHAGQTGFGGNMDVAGPKPAAYTYPPGAVDSLGNPLTGTVAYKNYASAEAGADGATNTGSGGRANMGAPVNPGGSIPAIAPGSIRLFTGGWSGTTLPTLSSIESGANTLASVWHDASGADVFDNATIQLALRDMIPTVANTFVVSNTAVGTPQAVGGAILVTGSNNKYSSEVDQLLDPSVNKGTASVQTIGDESGFLWVMAKVTGTAADVTAIVNAFNNGAAGDSATAAQLHSLYGPQFAGGDFNLLFRTANIAGAKNVNWDFSGGNPGAVVDQMAVVPEPATMGLMGFAGLGLLARRRRNRA